MEPMNITYRLKRSYLAAEASHRCEHSCSTEEGDPRDTHRISISKEVVVIKERHTEQTGAGDSKSDCQPDESNFPTSPTPTRLPHFYPNLRFRMVVHVAAKCDGNIRAIKIGVSNTLSIPEMFRAHHVSFMRKSTMRGERKHFDVLSISISVVIFFPHSGYFSLLFVFLSTIGRVLVRLLETNEAIAVCYCSHESKKPLLKCRISWRFNA